MIRPVVGLSAVLATPAGRGQRSTGGRRALGSLLVVDPRWALDQHTLPVVAARQDLALLPLAGPAALLTALAADALLLRQLLDTGFAELDEAPLST